MKFRAPSLLGTAPAKWTGMLRNSPSPSTWMRCVPSLGMLGSTNQAEPRIYMQNTSNYSISVAWFDAFLGQWDLLSWFHWYSEDFVACWWILASEMRMSFGYSGYLWLNWCILVFWLMVKPPTRQIYLVSICFNQRVDDLVPHESSWIPVSSCFDFPNGRHPQISFSACHSQHLPIISPAPAFLDKLKSLLFIAKRPSSHHYIII